MRKTKHQTQFRPLNHKHEDMTPKIMAKSPLVYRQRKIAGKSSALPTHRIRQKETNIFEPQKPPSPFSSPTKPRHIISEQQVKGSSMYKLLEEQILVLIRRQQSEFQKLDELRKAKDDEIRHVKNQQREIKMEIWQLRNETMELKDAIQTETEQNERMMEELGVLEEDFNVQQIQAEEEQGEYENNENNQNDDSSEND